MIALTKTLDPERDYLELAPELALVDAVGIGEQHPMRRWEYSMALHALAQHQQGYVSPLAGYLVADVGGAGSPFHQMVPHALCHVIDPKVNVGIEDFHGPDDPVDAVTSISTIEHVKEPLPFLQACHRVLAPGGLLFLTMDCWDGVGPDTAMFHWMRERIYNLDAWLGLVLDCEKLGFRQFGEADWDYHGNHLFDAYTFASLAMTKEA